jgi:hypothetical protein
MLFYCLQLEQNFQDFEIKILEKYLESAMGLFYQALWKYEIQSINTIGNLGVALEKFFMSLMFIIPSMGWVIVNAQSPTVAVNYRATSVIATAFVVLIKWRF